jgi:hypothetical protein
MPKSKFVSLVSALLDAPAAPFDPSLDVTLGFGLVYFPFDSFFGESCFRNLAALALNLNFVVLKSLDSRVN